MRENTLKIEINAPIETVFVFTINPANTPRWITHLKEEAADHWPAKVGTIYRNRDESGIWSAYEVIDIQENKFFIMKDMQSSYHVQYDYAQLPNSDTELTYHEWVEDGELSNPFSQAVLEKLKSVIENN